MKDIIESPKLKNDISDEPAGIDTGMTPSFLYNYKRNKTLKDRFFTNVKKTDSDLPIFQYR